MKTILLSDKVRVSDPCYDNDVWCKTKLENVLPGNYSIDVDKSDEGSWGNRCSSIIAIHEDYLNKGLDWEDHSEIGVDSGQAGIFCESSYRNDEVSNDITTPVLDRPFDIPFREDGDKWYDKMCKLTLSGEGWGSYETGAVSSSGYGDGGYPLDVARNESGNIIGMRITFIFPEDEEEDEEWDDDDQDE